MMIIKKTRVVELETPHAASITDKNTTLCLSRGVYTTPSRDHSPF